MQNYPNPFNQSTIIQFKVESLKFIKLIVFDVTGKEIAMLINEEKQAGEYTVRFDARLGGASTGELASGIYFYQLISNGNIMDTRKMIYLR